MQEIKSHLFTQMLYCCIARLQPVAHLIMAALWNRAGRYIFVLCFVFIYLSFFLFSAVEDLISITL